MVTLDAVDRYLGLGASLLTAPMAQAVLAFSATDEVKQRVIELADKANLGVISPEEQEEYLRYIELDELVTILKSRVRKFLASPS